MARGRAEAWEPRPFLGAFYLAEGLPGAAVGGVVLYLYLLAPYVLLDDLGVLHHVLADADLFLDHRALANDDLFFGHRHDDLVLTNLDLRCFTLDGHALYGDLFMPCRY